VEDQRWWQGGLSEPSFSTTSLSLLCTSDSSGRNPVIVSPLRVLSGDFMLDRSGPKKDDAAQQGVCPLAWGGLRTGGASERSGRRSVVDQALPAIERGQVCLPTSGWDANMTAAAPPMPISRPAPTRHTGPLLVSAYRWLWAQSLSPRNMVRLSLSHCPTRTRRGDHLSGT
jgi:hypothetical protein